MICWPPQQDRISDRMKRGWCDGPESHALKWSAPSKWSFRLNAAWDSIDTTTFRKTRPTLVALNL